MTGDETVPSSTLKAAARRSARAARRAAAADPAAMVGHLLALLDRPAPLDGPPRAAVRRLGHRVACVAAFAAAGSEPDTDGLLDALARRGTSVLLPVLLPDDDLAWRRLDGPLVGGRRATRHPAGPDVDLALADLVVVPALAVDRSGTRLGQGGGSYDRALPRRRPGVPVLAWLHPGGLVASPLPAAATDVPVDGAVLPEGVWWRLGG